MDMKRYTILACLLLCAGMKCSTAWAQGESLATRLHYYIEDSERGFLVTARLVEATGLSQCSCYSRDQTTSLPCPSEPAWLFPLRD